jgi:hypothetical protein
LTTEANRARKENEVLHLFTGSAKRVEIGRGLGQTYKENREERHGVVQKPQVLNNNG